MTRSRILFLFAVTVLALGFWAVLPASDSPEVQEPQAELSLDTPDPFSPAKKPGTACCDPAAEPGVGGNPFCFEGHTCCSDGVWRCNNPDASPSCNPGNVCPAGCGGRGDSCASDGDCCSGVCKRNGRCQ